MVVSRLLYQTESSEKFTDFRDEHWQQPVRLEDSRGKTMCSKFQFGFILSLFMVTVVNLHKSYAEDLNSLTMNTLADDCQITPVIHVLQYPGCVPKPIPSFACTGRCSSYLQVSGSKIWQMERSCMCCQESGEREASVSLFCPKAKPGDKKFRKVTTKAPLECMCRPCTSVEESSVVPQEMLNYPNEQPISGHFAKIE